MDANRNTTRWFLPTLCVALIAWGVVIAVGAYLGSIRFGYNPGRGLVVAVAVLAFLALWGVLLYGRSHGRGR